MLVEPSERQSEKELDATGDTHFLERAKEIVCDGMFAQPQFRSDLLVCLPCRRTHNLYLPGGKEKVNRRSWTYRRNASENLNQKPAVAEDRR